VDNLWRSGRTRRSAGSLSALPGRASPEFARASARKAGRDLEWPRAEAAKGLRCRMDKDPLSPGTSSGVHRGQPRAPSGLRPRDSAASRRRSASPPERRASATATSTTQVRARSRVRRLGEVGAGGRRRPPWGRRPMAPVLKDVLEVRELAADWEATLPSARRGVRVRAAPRRKLAPGRAGRRGTRGR